MKNREPKNLEELLEEAKSSLKPESIDWKELDEQLFVRLESKTDTSGVRKSGLARTAAQFAEPKRGWQFAGLLASAAAIAFALHPGSKSSSDAKHDDKANGAFDSHAHAEALASVMTREGGDVRIGGEIAAAGRSLSARDWIETTRSRAEFSSTEIQNDQGNDASLRVAWMLEDHSRVMVRSLGGGGAPLVLELAAGSVEAQVTPVERGEAFAIDLRAPQVASEVASKMASGAHDVVRIAVHGTHLRVARDASGKATIDLSEGVVSIGFPPKVGATYGTLISAPAHIELDVARFIALGGSALVIDKNAASVRTPTVLATHGSIAATDSSQGSASSENGEPLDQEHVDQDRLDQNREAPPQATERVAQVADPHAEETIRAAARACAAVRESSNEVQVTIRSKLSLHIGADGMVKLARFEPPLSPEAQECAGKTIYKVRFPPTAGANAARDVEIAVEVDP